MVILRKILSYCPSPSHIWGLSPRNVLIVISSEIQWCITVVMSHLNLTPHVICTTSVNENFFFQLLPQCDCMRTFKVLQCLQDLKSIASTLSSCSARLSSQDWFLWFQPVSAYPRIECSQLNAFEASHAIKVLKLYKGTEISLAQHQIVKQSVETTNSESDGKRCRAFEPTYVSQCDVQGVKTCLRGGRASSGLEQEVVQMGRGQMWHRYHGKALHPQGRQTHRDTYPRAIWGVALCIVDFFLCSWSLIDGIKFVLALNQLALYWIRA